MILMHSQKIALVLAVALSSAVLTNGCVTALVGASTATAGAVIGSDSRTVDIQVDDQKIESQALKYLTNDKMKSDSKVFRVDCISVNGNVVLVGQTKEQDYLNWAIGYIKKIQNVRKVYNYVENIDPVSAGQIASDAYTTSKVKSALLLGSKINSGRFKVYTENNVVFLLGYVTHDEAQRAINQVGKVSDGIRKIVTVFDYMDGVPSAQSSTAPVVNASSGTSSSSYAAEAQQSVDNGGAVLLEDDSDLLAPATPHN